MFLTLYIREKGFNVECLGPCAPTALTIEAAASLKSDLVVISTLNGHGFSQGRELARAFRGAGLESHPTLVIGGLLATDESEQLMRRLVLLQEGYAEVFSGAGSLDKFATWLRLFAERRYLLGQPAIKWE